MGLFGGGLGSIAGIGGILAAPFTGGASLALTGAALALNNDSQNVDNTNAANVKMQTDVNSANVQNTKDTNSSNYQIAQDTNLRNYQIAQEVNASNYRIAQENNAFNAEQIARQEDFQTQMSNTSYQRGIQDMKAAGLNPMLAYSQGGASTPTGGAATAQSVTQQAATMNAPTMQAAHQQATKQTPFTGNAAAMANGINATISSAQAMADLKNKDEMNSQIKAQTLNTQADTLQKSAHTENTQQLTAQSKQQVNNLQTQVEELNSRLLSQDQDRKTSSANEQHARAQASESAQRTANNKQQYDIHKPHQDVANSWYGRNIKGGLDEFTKQLGNIIGSARQAAATNYLMNK